MSINCRLTNKSYLVKFFRKLGLISQFTSSVFNHILQIIDGMLSQNFNGTLSDIHKKSFYNRCRQTISHMMTNSKWDEKILSDAIKNVSYEEVIHQAKIKNKPYFLIIDDTVCHKTKPSSLAKHPMQEASYHYSNLDKRSVYGHSIVQAMLHTDGLSYPIEVKRAHKKENNKMDNACNIISSAPEPDHKAYVCVDSWYISKKIIETSLKKGFHFIGVLKIDIVICPLGIKNQIKMFLKFIKNKDTKVVTIKKQKYHVYRYEGNLNFIDNAVVLICVKEGQDISKAKAFICTDMELSNEEILNYYSKRWEIETYFRAAKNNLALQGYQVRSRKALDRYLILQMFVAMYCIHTGNGNLLKGLRKYQAKKEADRIEDMIDILISSLKEIISNLDIPTHISVKLILSRAKKGLRAALRSYCYQFKEVA